VRGEQNSSVSLAVGAVLLALLTGCAATFDAPSLPTISAPETVVPSDGLPAEVVLQDAANNLDVVEHEGEVFFAFRVAPSHFASRDAMLYVVRSADEQTWSFEASFWLETDLREPRLLSLDGRLLLYFAVLGESPLDFEPQGMMVSERLGDGEWSEPEWLYDEGFIPWRARVIDGTAYLIGYVGGENIYDFNEASEQVHLLTTDDGRDLRPVIPDQPVVHDGGLSEVDFAVLDDGTLVAVGRNELGDEDGWGSKICRAEAGDWGQWQCATDPRKYDSPLVFRTADDRVYLVGRRNLSETGNYDLFQRDLDPADQTLQYELDYWQHPKRCSLWRVDPEALAVTFVLDLPSRGDTCFPSALDRGDGRFTIYNYTSPLDGPDLNWIEGQTGETRIVRVDVQVP
jgi:hypothetical protein